MHLNAARFLIERVSFEKTMRGLFMLDGVDEFPQDVDFWMEHLEQTECVDVSPQQAMTDARNFRELEALVKVLDNLETMSSLVELSSEYVLPDVLFAAAIEFY
jgi:nuclear pore complex protein Nup107